jgi:hypothetical protein
MSTSRFQVVVLLTDPQLPLWKVEPPKEPPPSDFKCNQRCHVVPIDLEPGTFAVLLGENILGVCTNFNLACMAEEPAVKANVAQINLLAPFSYEGLVFVTGNTAMVSLEQGT